MKRGYKLKEPQRRAIYIMHELGTPNNVLAYKYGVTSSNITYIIQQFKRKIEYYNTVQDDVAKYANVMAKNLDSLMESIEDGEDA